MGIHDHHREKMRQRYLKSGLDSFADHEALELLLFYAIPRQDTNPIAHELMNRFGSLKGVMNAPIEQLQEVEGLGERSAILLRLVLELSRKAYLEELEQEVCLTDTRSTGRYLLQLFAGQEHEQLYQLCLDRKGKLLACRLLGEGAVDAVGLNLQRMVENTILTHASSVILAHNHPSGFALPSQGDYIATDQARDALATIGITLEDHIVVADNDYVSMRDDGYLGSR